MEKMEISSEAPEPPSPKYIMEISFKSFGDQYDACQKMKIDDPDEKESRLFWLGLTRDYTKLNEMQNVFQYLRWAKIRPKLNAIRKARYFEIWRKNVYYKRWNRFRRNVSRNNYLSIYHENADRVCYVRTKIAGKVYKQVTDETHPGIDLVSDLTNKVVPLNVLSPRPGLPGAVVSRDASPIGSPQLSPIGSPKKSPRKRRPRSPPKPQVVHKYVQMEPIKEEVSSQTAPPPPPSNLPIFILVFLIALCAGVVTFFMVSPTSLVDSSDVWNDYNSSYLSNKNTTLDINETNTTAEDNNDTLLIPDEGDSNFTDENIESEFQESGLNDVDDTFEENLNDVDENEVDHVEKGDNEEDDNVSKEELNVHQ